MKQFLLKYLFIALAGNGLLNCANAQFYNGSHVEFGKNRVQYGGFKWQFYDFERFKVYFNGDGKFNAIYAARSSHEQLQELETAMNLRIDDKIEIVVYNRHSDFKQSNIGLTATGSSNIGGVSKLIDNKVFVYFDGRHDHFQKEIRYGLTQVIVAQMIHGSSWKSLFRTPSFDIMPYWFMEGFMRFMAYGWDAELDNKTRDAIMQNKFSKFNHLEGEEAALAGHAFWNYISEKYGTRPITNLFYIATSARSIDNGLYIVMNMSLLGMANDFVRYYRERYKIDSTSTQSASEEEIKVKTKKKAHIYGYRLSETGNKLAYVSNVMGRYKVMLHNIDDGKQKAIFKAEHKAERKPDLSFPILTWHPNREALAFVVEKKGNLLLVIYDVEEHEKTEIELRKLNKVLSLNYSPDGKTIVMSGVANGQSDIYTYQIIGNVLKNLTDDSFDDLSPAYVGTTGKIIFSSNRPTDSIPRRETLDAWKPVKKDYDLYQLDPNGPGGRVLISRITDTPTENEMNPFFYGKNSFSYMSDQNGIHNRKIAFYDSTISHIDTVIHYRYFTKTAMLSNYDRNATDFHVIQQGRNYQYGFVNLKNGKHHFYRGQANDDKPFDEGSLLPTEYKRIELGLKGGKSTTTKTDATNTTIIVEPEKGEIDDIDIDNYQFDMGKPQQYEKVIINLEQEAVQVNESKKEKEQLADFALPDQKLYKKNFVFDKWVFQFDNNMLNETYQRFIGPGAAFPNPGISPIFKISLTDVFEDNILTAGFRLGGDFRSNEMLVRYENFTGRTDHTYVGYRGSFLTQFGNNRVRSNTTEARYQAKYPFSEFLALRGTVGYRNDQYITLSTAGDLGADNLNFHQATGRVELIFDNAISRGLNLLNGLRFKFFGEYFREINMDKANIFVFGGDIRHYQKVHRQIIWANRLAFSSSFGDKRLLHYLGGVDNWMFRRNPSFDQSLQVDMTQNYAFQTIATPMRGFVQNARNGNTFALFNSELRVPVVRYFTNRPLKSDFWNTFQVIGFFDIGAAWNGPHPYANNSFNTIIIEHPPFTIEIENLREPIIWGYGFGLRGRINGYFVRFDWAWGVDDFERLRSIRYLSFTLDF